MDWPVAVANGWHPVALHSQMREGTVLSRQLLGERLVVFRGCGRIGVLRDACPHRGVPLSRGRVVEGAIQCPYHGWRFAADGACTAIPGVLQCAAIPAKALPVVEAAGAIWTSLASEPPPFPTLPDAFSDDGLDRFWWDLPASPGGVLDALENHLDPAHPHFLHPWLVRSPGRRSPVRVKVSEGPWGARAEYIEDRRNAALLPAAMEGRRAASIGRLWPPTIGEVRMQAASGKILSIAVVFVPEAHGLTRPLAHFASTRGMAPGFVKRWLLKAFHLPVIPQDRSLLRWQQENRAHGPLSYALGPLDVLARAIWRHANDQQVDEASRELELLL